MALYDYRCTKCYTTKEIKLSFAEHDALKTGPMTPDLANKITCECGYIMVQKVSPIRFKLEGQGWFGDSQTCADPYGITEQEMRKNLDMEKRIEDDANTLQAKEQNVKEL